MPFFDDCLHFYLKFTMNVVLDRDGLPVIVYDSRITKSLENAHKADFLTGANLIRLMTDLKSRLPILRLPGYL